MTKCKKVKAYLNEHNIPFEEISMLTNLGPAMEIMKKSGKKDLPLIDIEGTIIIGPDQTAIDKALRL